jgi:3-hydroxyacyl-CoA dehydrogenase
MTVPVRIERQGAVGLVALDHPPVNALSRAVRLALLGAVEELDRDDQVGVIVIIGIGAHFAAGADIAELAEGAQAPLLAHVLTRIEDCGKPVLAAMHGAALGGGAELALACHYRAATSDLSFGFPEIQLGLIPGAGGTIRLPRLVGPVAAIRMITSGRRLSRADAIAAGVVDQALDGDLGLASLEWARSLLDARAPVRRTTQRTVSSEAASDFATAPLDLPRPLRRLPAVGEAIQAVQAALTMPPELALRDARERFERCRGSTESRALRHLFFAERQRPDDSAARRVQRIGVVGAGTMGSGIALAAALGGLEVLMIDPAPRAVEHAMARMRNHVDESCARGRLTPMDGAAVIRRVSTGTSLVELAAADLVVEAVVEDLRVKCAVFGELARNMSPHTVLATNTSTLDINAIAMSAGDRATDVVGMHFFSPAHIMPVVEIIRGNDTSDAATATVARVARQLGKIAVVAGNSFGFIGNRMLYAYGREKELMLLQGVDPARIDGVLENFGMAMGPNAVGDLAGLDVGWQARRAWSERPSDGRYWRATDRLAELGRFGRKTGRGFYQYEAGVPTGARRVDPEAVDIIRAESERLGVVPREWADEEIVERCVLALIREGAELLQRKVARSEADIDVIWCNGYGFPRERGGPMFHGMTLGWRHVLRRLRDFAVEPGGEYWLPSVWLERRAAESA